MSIVKKLPAVLIAAAGISFSFVGTALAERILVDNKTFGPGEKLEFTPTDFNSQRTKLCFQTSDNLWGQLSVKYFGSPTKLHLIDQGIDQETHSLPKSHNLTLNVSPNEECIELGKLLSPLKIMNPANPDSFFLSQSIRVHVTQP